MSDVNRAAEFNYNPHLPEWYLSQLDDVFYSRSPVRNFTIHPIQTHSKFDLVLINENKKMESLGKFLPEKDTFVLGLDNQYHSRSHTVEVDANILPYRGSVLRILHELGHARTHTPHPFHDQSLIKKAHIALESMPRFLKVRKELKRQPQHLGDTTFEALFAQPFANEMINHSAKEERTAWAEALTMAKQLEKEGFNVLGEFDGVDEIREFITFMLMSYEYSMRYGQQLAGDKVTPGKFTRRAP